MNKLKSYFAIYSIHINLIWMRMDIIEIQKKIDYNAFWNQILCPHLIYAMSKAQNSYNLSKMKRCIAKTWSKEYFSLMAIIMVTSLLCLQVEWGRFLCSLTRGWVKVLLGACQGQVFVSGFHQIERGRLSYSLTYCWVRVLMEWRGGDRKSVV